RRQLDEPAQAFGVHVGTQALDDLDAVDGADGDRVHLDRAAAAAEIGAAGIGVEQDHAAEGGAVQVAVDAADFDEAAFTSILRQRYARHAAQRFGGVEVRILLDDF